ncbi:papain fold toxin domain-containing protein [Aquimarina mycalae]|uniref:papain fold toxin domain-containing protein n=1 Tax=Aquimarina mycalae TaxID=3040073 RepID=UPI00403B047F
MFSKTQNDVISTNGYHYGVEVDGKVFDNIHTGGIDYSDWKADFEVLVGASVKQVDNTHL